MTTRKADCWETTSGLDKKGYGRVWDRTLRKMVFAHREAYRRFVGPIPDGLFVLHKCDNPPCCNPDHLFLGTNADNQADMTAKGRRSPGQLLLRGASNPHAVFSDDDVRAIRKDLAAGRSNQAIATDRGVSNGTISRIKNRRTWRHI
jgi:hypothetical protein